MASQDILYMTLGCHGYYIAEDKFCVCKGIENRIFTLKSDFYFFKEVMAYLDGCKLFDKPLFDFNAIRNFISIFRQKFELPISPVWIERRMLRYHKFLIDHKDCGLFLKLELAENIKNNLASK
jgi:hypothetical protein